MAIGAISRARTRSIKSTDTRVVRCDREDQAPDRRRRKSVDSASEGSDDTPTTAPSSTDTSRKNSPFASPKSSPTQSPSSSGNLSWILDPYGLGLEGNDAEEKKRNLSRQLTRRKSNLNRDDSTLSDFLVSVGVKKDSRSLQPTLKRDVKSATEFRNIVRERRGERKDSLTKWKRPSMIDAVDRGIEQSILSTEEKTWFLLSCGGSPSCERICHPAEYATRRHRGDEAEDEAGGHAEDKEQKALRMFGLPEWDKAGYSLMTYDESRWADELVPTKLGLQLAVHRKTSVERLCLQQDKASLPCGVKRDDIKDLVRNLKKCDHVNMLRCHEVCEDESCLYFLYENFPCVTLLSVLENLTLTQEQLVNVIRECIAAVAYANSHGLFHLGWTLCHLLLPVSTLNGDPTVAKIFGFGLQGTVQLECNDRRCWSPEACENFLRSGDKFLHGFESHTKSQCDLWSLGNVLYTLIAGRTPFLGTQEAMTDQIIARKWSFALGFDKVDAEAKSLVEGLMEKRPDKRVKAQVSLRHEWIRQRWTPPNHRHRAFHRLEEFCNAPLAKRLFGRFLVRFLDAEHMREIAHAFYSLDHQGDGMLCSRDLQACAKACGRPVHAAKTIIEWMCSDSTNGTICITRFAECMAEDVIDGKALRHAFESLDDDGSEEISAEELYDELHPLDENLTMEMILEHIETAENNVHGAGDLQKGDEEAEDTNDHKIDFEEFVHLFPVRLKRLADLRARTDASAKHAEEARELLEGTSGEAAVWAKELQAMRNKLDELSQACCHKEKIEAAVKDMKTDMVKIAVILSHPPGPSDEKSFHALMHGTQKKKKSKKKKASSVDLLGFDSFIQDQAINEYWGNLVSDEIRMLKTAIMKDNLGNTAHVDVGKAHDCADSAIKKLDVVLEWTRDQMEEYQSFVEVMLDPEPGMPAMTLSGRGLQHHDHGDEDGEEDNESDAGGSKSSGMFTDFVRNFSE